jgi:chorismate-pyruvate lyase
MPRVPFARTLEGTSRPASTPIIAEPAECSFAWAALLERFYARTGTPVPVLHLLEGDHVPHPYKKLLVHSSDMTSTLEAFYQQPMSLVVLSREHQSGAYLREVVLRGGNDLRPVEYGVIRISLDRLPAAARAHVLQEKRPLGNILQTQAVAHLSWPQAFFRTLSDAHTASVLALPKARMLYGRRNVLLDASRHLLAEVIEILAPVENNSPIE